MMYLSIDGSKKVKLKDNANLEDISSWLSNNKNVGYAVLYNEGDRVMQWTFANKWQNVPEYDEPR